MDYKTLVHLEGALKDVFISQNESDSNMEPANVVDGLFAIARALQSISKEIEGVADRLGDMRNETL